MLLLACTEKELQFTEKFTIKPKPVSLIVTFSQEVDREESWMLKMCLSCSFDGFDSFSSIGV